MIEVLDAPCGSGKTTHIFKQMKEGVGVRWMYVSPYLSEVGGEEQDGKYVVGRIQQELPELDFRYPVKSPNKKEHLVKLLEKGDNVAITHSLFSQLPDEAIIHIKEQGYTLIIDETIDFVSLYGELSSDDVWLLLETGILIKEPDNKLTFTDKEYNRGILSEVKTLADDGCLYLYGNDTLIQKVTKETIEAFTSTTVLTYLFESSLMAAWMKLNNIPYTYIYPNTMRSEQEIKQELKQLLNVIKPPRFIETLCKDKPTAFSVNWYKKQEQDTLDQLKASMENTLKKGMSTGNTFWTTFKDYKKHIEGNGYTRPKTVVVDNITLVNRTPFVPKNMRASNEYSDCTNCIYCCNVYMNPNISNFLGSKDITLDTDMYALSELIQFLFRGCIRKGLPMDILITSTRMRLLLLNWLNNNQ